MRYEIFICHHTSIKSDIAFPLMTLFSYCCGKNFAFFDSVSLDRGQQTPEAIREAIRTSRILLIILSKDFFKNDALLEEVSVFLQQNKTHPGLAQRHIIPIFYQISSLECANLPEAVCFDSQLPPSFWSLARKQEVGRYILAATERDCSFSYQQDTQGYFWVDLVLNILNNKVLFKNACPFLRPLQTLSDTMLRRRLFAIYQATLSFQACENEITPEIFVSFLSDLNKGKRTHFSISDPRQRISANSLHLSQPSLSHFSVDSYLQRLQYCIEHEDSPLFLTTWEQLTEGRQFCSPEEVQCIGEFAEPLGMALLDLKKPYEVIMEFYNPWLKHPHIQSEPIYWIMILAATAHRYYRAEEYATAKRLYQDIVILYQNKNQHLLETLMGLMKATFLMGDLAEATLYALYIHHLSTASSDCPLDTLDPIWFDILENSVFLHLVGVHQWDARHFGQLLRSDHDRSQYLLPFLKALHDTAHRLWLLSEKCSDPVIQRRLVHTAHEGYSYIIRIMNNEKVSLPIVPLGNTAFSYRGATALPDTPIPDFLAKEVEYGPAPWRKVQSILQNARQNIVQRFSAAVVGSTPPALSSSVLPVQALMTQAIKEAVDCLLKEGQKLWGAPPCKFAFLGMGSLAREEACPFSDLEFAIVLEDLSLLYQKTEAIRYFKTWVQWAEWQLIVIGETQRLVTWPSSPGTGLLSVPIKPGFRLDDGGNVPFSGKGAKCFIGSVEDLLENFTLHFSTSDQGSEVSGDTIGANALQHADRLGGDPTCVTAFQQKLWQRFQRQDTPSPDGRSVWPFHQRWALHLLDSHSQNSQFKIALDEKCTRLHIKDGLLRWPTFVVETLALYAGIPLIKTDKRLEALESKNWISSAMGSALMLSIHAALWWRHRVHLYYGYEEETVYFSLEAASAVSPDLSHTPSQSLYVLSPSEKEQLYMLYHLLLEPTRQLLEKNLPHFISGTVSRSSPLQDISLYQAARHRFPALAEVFTQYARLLPTEKRLLEATHCQRFLSAIQASSPSPAVPPASSLRLWNVQPATPSSARLLSAVVCADIEKVTQHLRQYPQDVYTADNITDFAQRTFYSVTAFQYALWAGDQPLCKLLLTYLPKKEAAQQWRMFAQERTDIHPLYGVIFTLEPLLHHYHRYIEACTRQRYSEAAEIWGKQIGVAQAQWPIWLIRLFMASSIEEKGKKAMGWSQTHSSRRLALSTEHPASDAWKKFHKSPVGNGAWVRGPMGPPQWVSRADTETAFGNHALFAEHDCRVLKDLSSMTQNYYHTLTDTLQATLRTAESPSTCCLA